MRSDVVHLLTGGPDLSQCRIACGASEAVYALRQREAVTCPQCRDTLRSRVGARDRRRTTAGGMSEQALQELVRQAAGWGGWLYFHVWNSRNSPSGYPDVTAVRGSRLVCAELKRRGQVPTQEQQRWLEALGQVRTVETYLWTEDDVHTLLEVFR